MRYLGGHLGITVSALLDGQLDVASGERAWAHVHGCEICYRQVEREGWVKTQLAAMTGDDGPPPQLLGSLYGLGARLDAADRPGAGPGGPGLDDGAAAWAAVQELERRGRGRRRTGIAIAGAGSVSVALLGFASLTGSTLGIGSAPAGSPTTALTGTGVPTSTPSTGFTMVVAPSDPIHGTLRERLPQRDDGDEPTPADDIPAGQDVTPGQEPGEASSDLRP